ncbi:GNAT family N-acetyltransferase [Brevibacillus sp. AG]|uniref:GNAT family N-acetyltransferase n=1 Tax=Brevibacillus sp. AG TaxID=3020891 RepID=UPI00233040F8|nr:GNAT family N-acetyltransferase [Brevibacillus sp. AG]MDC0764246.1 GNAT family N-acetyltransferase [Brevibacillus sp. AG]
MEFSPNCTNDELVSFIKKYDLELNWDWAINISDCSCIVEDVYKVEDNGEIIGLIDFSFKTIFGSDSIQIENFEVFEKGKGIGSKIINALIDQLPGVHIYLYVNDERSKSFWEKHKFMNDPGTLLHHVLTMYHERISFYYQKKRCKQKDIYS